MKKYYLIFIAFWFNYIYAQDFHFSQTSQNPLLINPGCAGAFDGWERISINQRNQWLGSTTQFMSTNLSADANFFKNARKPKSHIGVGVHFFNDIGGDSKFGTQNGSITLSGILPMGNGHQISLGIQSGFGKKSADISKLTFENQWNGSTFEPSIASGEVNSLNSFAYTDVSSGIYYVFNGSQSSFTRENESKVQLGVSVYHINQPKLKYIQGSRDQLQRKYVIHGSIIRDILESQWSIDASALQFIQGGHYETILSSMFRYRFQNGTKMTGFYGDGHMGFGIGYRLNDAVIPSFMIDLQSLKFMLSYDVTVSNLRKAKNGGSIEISLTYTNLHNAIFKGRNKNKKSLNFKN